MKLSKHEFRVYIFLFMYIMTVVSGGVILWVTVFSEPTTITPLRLADSLGMGFIILCMGLSLGLGIHGFHPFLLFRYDRKTEKNVREYDEFS